LKPAQLLRELKVFHGRFEELADRYDGTLRDSSELAAVIDEYSAFVTDGGNAKVWERLESEASREIDRLAADIRKTSSRCVALMEKYRALKLLAGEGDRNDYFHNIEACIEQEFGSFRLTSESKVLLIGSGAFPMTPLYIARRTGAEVIGIDIDAEAIALGRQVVERLGSGLRIRLEQAYVEQLDGMRDVTHIVISSTVAIKYDLLDQLHGLTNEQVVAAMRYGNGLKSLFNYPMQETDRGKWHLAMTMPRQGQVFDIALYVKAQAAQRADREGGVLRHAW
jgi:histidine 2-aminobutanoyltransferase